jgi:hypothetical protein
MILTFRLDLQISSCLPRDLDTCRSCPRSCTFGAPSWPGALTSSDTTFSPGRPSQVALRSDLTFDTHAAMHFQVSLPSSPDGLNLHLSHAPTHYSLIAHSFDSFRPHPSSSLRRQTASHQQRKRLFNSPSLSQTPLSSRNPVGMFGPPKLAIQLPRSGTFRAYPHKSN